MEGPLSGVNAVVRTIATTDLQMVMVLSFDRHAPRQHVAGLIDRLIALPEVTDLAELEGAADLMIQAVLPNLAAYRDFIATYVDPARRFISRADTNFICRRYSSSAIDDDVVWAQGRRGMRPISLARIDCLTAEGDYVRILSDGEAALLHSTLQSLIERLPPDQFVQIHRGTVVRRSSVRRLIRSGRRWQVELPDRSTHLIAKSRVAEFEEAIESGRASRLLFDSSKSAQFDGAVEPI